jgi:hypothetical protein
MISIYLFILCQNIWIPGNHPASYPMDTGGWFTGVKRPGCEADYSPVTTVAVKKTWIMSLFRVSLDTLFPSYFNDEYTNFKE